jgi:hypothetical protein
MDLLEALTPAIESILFPPVAPDTADISGVVVISDVMELVGIALQETGFVVAFLGVQDQAGWDVSFIDETAAQWTRFEAGSALDLNARLVKFFRKEASQETMFDPVQNPLPAGLTIWKFQELLTRALVAYTEARPAVSQFFFFPQTAELDRWYNRLGKKFCQPQGALNSGIVFRKIAGPIHDDEGGFYGYQRS